MCEDLRPVGVRAQDGRRAVGVESPNKEVAGGGGGYKLASLLDGEESQNTCAERGRGELMGRSGEIWEMTHLLDAEKL